MLEVQRELYENDVPSQAGNKRRRISTSTVSRFTLYDTPPSSSVKVELVERSNSTTRVFPQYQIKNPQLWPKEDYFNAVMKKLDYRKKFKVDNTVLSYKKTNLEDSLGGSLLTTMFFQYMFGLLGVLAIMLLQIVCWCCISQCVCELCVGPSCMLKDL